MEVGTLQGLSSICFYGIVLPRLPSMKIYIDYFELLKPIWFAFNENRILLLFIAMQHPHLWKYFYFEMVEVQSIIPEWNSIMEDAYKFSEFYNTTPRTDKACLPYGSMDKKTCLTDATHLTDTLQKPYISGCFDIEGENEGFIIQKCVEDFVLYITKQVESSNKKLAATPILSGSVAEGTKVGVPDEYDFILHLYGLQDAFDKHFEQSVAHQPIFGKGFNTSAVFEEYIDAFRKQVKEYQHHMKDFFVVKSPLHTSDVKPFTITLYWLGHSFKNLKVSIDFVPAFKFSFQSTQIRLWDMRKECDNSQIFAVCKHNESRQVYLRLSYSLHERDLLQALPICVKNGYRLAKAVRHTEVCPNMQLSDKTFASVYDYVTTYMLKTSLLHTTKECEQNHLDDNEWLSPLSIRWAIKIYEQMKFLLEIFEGKMPSYFDSYENVCFDQPIPHNLTDRQKQYYKKKTQITMNFIDCILQLLQELLHQRLQVRCLIQ